MIFTHKTTIIASEGAVNQLGAIVQNYEAKKALLVYDKGIKAAGLAADVVKIINEVGVDVVEFDGVLPDPPLHVINKVIELLENNKIDVIVALGGGSSIDTAKAANMAFYGQKPLLEMADKLEGVPNKGLPFVAIPTSSGTGSEVTRAAVITNEEISRKLTLMASQYGPDVAIIDPNMTKSMPPHITRSTGLDALAHLLEGYTTIAANDLVDSIAIQGTKMIVENLPKAIENGEDLDVRLNMGIAATLGGIVVSNAFAHLPHAFGHVIGSLYHIPHGDAIAMVMPWCMEYVADAIPDRTRKICELFGVSTSETPDENLPGLVRDVLKEFNDKLGEKRFADYEMITKNNLEEIADKVMLEELILPFAVKKLTKKDAYDILVRAYVHI